MEMMLCALEMMLCALGVVWYLAWYVVAVSALVVRW